MAVQQWYKQARTLIASYFSSQRFWARSYMLKYGSPESVELLSDVFEDLEKNVTEYMAPANYGSASNNEVHPLYPGATVM